MPEPAIDIDPLVVGDAGGDHAEDDAEDHTEDHAGDRPIALLRWPAQDAERRRLVARGEPRILLISHYGAPPGLLDDLEVWMLEGTEPRELLAAMTTLRRNARQRRPEPVVDDDGLLWFGGRWVVIPDTQLPVVSLLVRNVDRLVRNDDLRAAYRSAGGSATVSSFRTLVHRVGGRVAEVGLKLHVVRRRGAMLATTPPESPERP